MLYSADEHSWENNLVKSVCSACDLGWESLGDWVLGSRKYSRTNDYLCSVCVMVSGMCSMTYNEVVRIVQPGFQPWAVATPFLFLGFPRTLFNPDRKAACRWQETNYTNTITKDNGRRIDKRVTNSTACGNLSYLPCDRRDILLPWQNNLRIDH